MAASNNTNNLEIECFAYDSQLGPHNGPNGPNGPKGTVVIMDIKINDKQSIQYKPRVVFCLDRSGSMQYSMPNLIASLKAFKDCIIPQSLTPEQSLIAFERNLSTTLITFNDSVTKVYPSDSYITWEATSDKIVAGGNTNISGAIELAYKEFLPNECGWIVVMSDGVPNCGCVTLADFQKLANSCVPNVEILTLGYGIDYNPDILNTVGKFTYVDKPDTIPLVFGSIANEVKESWGIKCNISMNYSKLSETVSKTVIGNTNVGSLFNGRSYVYGAFLEGVDPQTVVDNCTLDISYIDVTSGNTVSTSVNVSTQMDTSKLDQEKASILEKITLASSTLELSSIITSLKDSVSGYLNTPYTPNTLSIPTKYQEKYYETRKGQISNEINMVTSQLTPEKFKELIESFKNEIQEWDDDCSLTHKKELLDLFEKLTSRNDQQQREALLCSYQTSSTCATQYSYSNPYDKPASITSMDYATACSKAYSTRISNTQ